jgi:hypothetical protein
MIEYFDASTLLDLATAYTIQKAKETIVGGYVSEVEYDYLQIMVRESEGKEIECGVVLNDFLDTLNVDTEDGSYKTSAYVALIKEISVYCSCYDFVKSWWYWKLPLCAGRKIRARRVNTVFTEKDAILRGPICRHLYIALGLLKHSVTVDLVERVMEKEAATIQPGTSIVKPTIEELEKYMVEPENKFSFDD